MGECSHERYKSGHYMTGARITRVTSDHKKNTICWYSARISHCEDCGADISLHDIHEVKTAEQYLASIGYAPAPERVRETKNNRLLKKQGELAKLKADKEQQEELFG
jgi:hypothetical protein